MASTLVDPPLPSDQPARDLSQAPDFKLRHYPEVVRVDNPPDQAEVDTAVKAAILDAKIAAAIRQTTARGCSGWPDAAEVEIAFGGPVSRWDICRVYRYVMGLK